MSEHITGIPVEIAALPEAEQGPALVRAIHARKLTAEIRDLAQDQWHLGVAAGLRMAAASLRAGADALPADSHLLPGIFVSAQTIELMLQEAVDGRA